MKRHKQNIFMTGGLALMVLLATSGKAADANDSSKNIIVGKYTVEEKAYGRPLIWFKPSPDSKGEYPLNVVRKFLKCFQSGDVQGAMSKGRNKNATKAMRVKNL